MKKLLLKLTLGLLLIPLFTNAQSNPPTFTSTGITTGEESTLYTYDITTADADSDAVTVTATTLPAWLTLTTTTTAMVSTLAGDGTRSFADGTGIDAGFDRPSGVVLDASGNLYIADYFNYRIRKSTPEGVVTTFAGSGVSGNLDGLGTDAQFKGPNDIAIDSDGNLYVADYAASKIRKITPGGEVTTLAGGTSSGYADGLGTDAKFKLPNALTVDASGNVFVADTWNNCIRKITPAGDVTTFAGSIVSGFADGTGTVAKFDGPSGITIDNSGNLYVSDANNYRIRKITPAGVVTTFAGSTLGYVDGIASEAKFSFMANLTIDGAGNLYVADASTNSKIRKITPGGVVSTLAGTSGGHVDGLGTVAKFSTPKGIAVNANGNVYVTDYSSDYIRKIVQTTTYTLSGTAPAGAGSYPVVLHADDGQGGTVDQSFTIIVEATADVTPPEITCPADIEQTADEGVCVATVEIIDPTATDNLSETFTFIGERSDELALTAAYPVGVTTITWTATDEAENTSESCEQTVTIEDNSAPTVVTQNITVQLDENGDVTVTPELVDNGSTDNCEIDYLEIAKNVELTIPTIYFTGNRDGMVWSANSDGSGSPTLLYNTSQGPVGIEVNLNSGILYFSGGANDSYIFSAPADGTGTIETLPNTYTESHHYLDLEFDWENNRVFFTTWDEGIFVGNADGTGSATKVGDVNGAFAITYNRTNDKIYYVSTNGVNIGVMNADGTNRNDTLFLVDEVQGITVDEVTGRLFWIEKDLGKVYTALADGSEVPYELCDIGNSLFEYGDSPDSGFGIDYNAATGMLYWTVNNKSNNMDYVLTAPADGSAEPQLLYSGNFGGIKGIAAGRNITGGEGEGVIGESVAYTCSDIGVNTVILEVTDVNGNRASKTATVTVEDNSAPTVVTQNITVELDADGLATIVPAQIDNVSTDACGIASYSLDITDFTCEDVGENTVTLTVTDVNENSNTATATVTVEDNSVPTVVTQNITVELDADGLATITAAQIDSESFDNCGIDTMSLNNTEFSCEDVGEENTVTLTVTDLNGNSDSATATVTIEDNSVPTVVTQNITVELNEDGLATITAAQIDSESFDNCGIDRMSLNNTEFSCEDVGEENTVTLTVTDIYGNSSTATAVVTVEDNVVPNVVAVAPFTLQLDEEGSTLYITVDDIENGSTDACGIESHALDVYDFDCSNVGENTVTLSVTDIHGNVGTATTVVTIEDNIAPVVMTQNVTVELNSRGEAFIDTDDIDNGSFDNCEVASMSLDITAFECSLLGDYTVVLTVIDVNGNTSSETATVTVVADDLDGDLIADYCDSDMDGDGVDNELDNCERAYNPDQDDVDFNGIGDVCDESDLYFPTGFSPNGDGVRDTLIITGLGRHGDNNFEVYNRWGNRVYYSQFYQNNWDGISRGQNVFNKNEKLPAGPYFYVLTTGYNQVYKGWIYINY